MVARVFPKDKVAGSIPVKGFFFVFVISSLFFSFFHRLVFWLLRTDPTCGGAPLPLPQPGPGLDARDFERKKEIRHRWKLKTGVPTPVALFFFFLGKGSSAATFLYSEGHAVFHLVPVVI